VRALERVGLTASCRNVPADPRTDVPSRSVYLGLEEYDITLSYLAPENPLKVCYRKAGLAPRPGVYRVGVWYWELESFPRAWVRHAADLSEVWAPTEFIARALRAALPIPVHSMLPGVELTTFAALPRRQLGLPENRFLFLFAFDMASYMARKNPLAVIRAFQRAFRHDDPVALVIKVTRGQCDPKSFAALTEAGRQAGALVLDRILAREESLALIAACDTYVSLHRSEGFGLTLAEAMLLGKPVIATAYSGNLDFMSPANSLLVNFKRVAIDHDHGVYKKGNVWAEPSVEHAASLMRQVFDHPEAARALGERAREEARKLLSLEAAGQRMARRLHTIRGGLTGPVPRARAG
jgi:glycosyltransferase involved in cell wall biosynthesis